MADVVIHQDERRRDYDQYLERVADCRAVLRNLLEYGMLEDEQNMALAEALVLLGDYTLVLRKERQS